MNFQSVVTKIESAIDETILRPLPFSYSLGPVWKFGKLAEIARRNNEWRKVARFVQKFNLIIHRDDRGKTIRRFRDAHPCFNYNGCQNYVVLAMARTNISQESKNEIYRIFDLRSYRKGVSLDS